MTETYRAFVLRQGEDNVQYAEFETLTPDDLPPGEVLVRVAYSSLNYKDGLAVTGRGKVVRSFPMVPGIDFAGEVIASSDAAYQAGDAVLVTGWGMGEKHPGGYAQRARVPAEWLVPLPDGLTPQRAMAMGTAGFTAMLAVIALERAGVTPEGGEVVVTGASGGAGSVAVSLLAELGYTVVASTGRAHLADYLTGLGASEVVGRFDAPERPLVSGRWAGAIDAVGGDTLAALLTEMAYGGCVAAYGLAGGSHLNTTVLPFILRGVSLVGIDSVMCPARLRAGVWARLAELLSPEKAAGLTTVAPLSDIPQLAERILNGDIRGRVVLDVTA